MPARCVGSPALPLMLPSTLPVTQSTGGGGDGYFSAPKYAFLFDHAVSCPEPVRQDDEGAQDGMAIAGEMCPAVVALPPRA